MTFANGITNMVSVAILLASNFILSFKIPITSKNPSYFPTTKLYAKRMAKTRSVSGFGGAAVQECPCGSSLGYMKCCGKIHRDPKAFAMATAEQVVRARYSAYALREVGK
jgi:hypothetical protein